MITGNVAQINGKGDTKLAKSQTNNGVQLKGINDTMDYGGDNPMIREVQ